MLTADQFQQIEKKNLENLVKKATAGKPLTATELTTLAEYTGEREQQLKTFKELAAALGVRVETLSRWRKEKNAPKGKSLKEWKEFARRREAINKQGSGKVIIGGKSFTAADVIDLKANLVKEQGEGQNIRNQLNTLELREKSEGLVPMSEAHDAIKAVTEPLRRLLDAMPKAVAVRANPADPQLAEEALREGLDQVFKLMEPGKNGSA